MRHYSDKNYQSDRDAKTRAAAHAILKLVWNRFPKIKSVIDIGCGVGTWLKVSREYGADRIKGVDGPWVEKHLLQVSLNEFITSDLTAISFQGERYDLAICLEVAEHLKEDSACGLVSFLTSSSDICLFSAAIPGQTGEGHVNEQWGSYWEQIFNEKDFVFCDVIRREIWSDESIPYWYRQNVYLVVRRYVGESLGLQFGSWNVVHPNQWFELQQRVKSTDRSWKRIVSRITNRFLIYGK